MSPLVALTGGNRVFTTFRARTRFERYPCVPHLPVIDNRGEIASGGPLLTRHITNTVERGRSPCACIELALQLAPQLAQCAGC
jgi:hypothetical protein